MNSFDQRSSAGSGSPQAGADGDLEIPALDHPLGAAIALLELEGCDPQFELGHQGADGADVAARDAEVVFRRDGFVFVLRTLGADPEFQQLVLPNFYVCEDAGEHLAALACADRVNARMKCVRLFSSSPQTFCASVDFLLAERAQVLPVLMRGCSALAQAVQAFRVLMAMR